MKKNIKTPLLPIITTLYNWKHAFIAIACSLGFFAFYYHVMATLPGHADDQCALGVNLTASNISFSALLSILMGIFIAGMIVHFQQKAAEKKIILSSLSGIGVVVGSMTVFCTICTIPVVSVFGLSFGLSIFTDFDITFKIVSLVLVLLGLYMLNKQLRGECGMCVSDN